MTLNFNVGFLFYEGHKSKNKTKVFLNSISVVSVVDNATHHINFRSFHSYIFIHLLPLLDFPHSLPFTAVITTQGYKYRSASEVNVGTNNLTYLKYTNYSFSELD